MAKIIVSGTTEAPVYTKSATTVVDGITLAITAPLTALSSAEQTEYYSKDTVGVAAGVGMIGGFVLGDMFGDKVPLLGGRR